MEDSCSWKIGLVSRDLTDNLFCPAEPDGLGCCGVGETGSGSTPVHALVRHNPPSEREVY